MTERTERRSRRSQVRAEALALFLEAHRRHLRLRGLAVSTRDGRLLAGAGPAPEKLVRLAIGLEAPPDVAMWTLRAGALDVIVVSHGGRLSHEIGSGVKRILAS
jgi:hypothetical protein